MVTFFLDLTAPKTRIFRFVNDSDTLGFIFKFDSPSPDVYYFECNLDHNKYWEICASPKIYQVNTFLVLRYKVFQSLVHGTHEFSVRAVDQAGNRDPTPASKLFEISHPSLFIIEPAGPSETDAPVTSQERIDPPDASESSIEDKSEAMESTPAPISEGSLADAPNTTPNNSSEKPDSEILHQRALVIQHFSKSAFTDFALICIAIETLVVIFAFTFCCSRKEIPNMRDFLICCTRTRQD